MTDAGLITQIRAGDREAASSLVGRYYDDCWRFAYRMIGDRTDAEDVVQDTFFRVLRGLERYQEQKRFRAWLFCILANRCRTLLVQRRRALRFVSDGRLDRIAAESADDAEDEEASYPPERLTDALQVALTRLGSRYREAFLLKHAEVLGKRDGSSINRQAHEQTAPPTAHVPLHGSMSPGPGSPALQSASAVAGPTPGSRMDSITGADALAPSSVASARPKNSGQPVLSPTSSVSAPAVEGLDAESAVLVWRVLDSASARGLPVVALALRVREGVRRDVPGPRIVVVTRNFAAALGDASTTLGPSASSTEIQAGAKAMVAGAPASALRQIRTARSSGSIAKPLVALADLTTYGVAPLQASTALAALMVHDRSDVSVQALRARVVSDILQGTPPNAALADRVRQAVPLDPLRSQAPFSSGGVGGLRDSVTRSRPAP